MVFIIAEAGVNHNGDFQLAKNLIDKAKSAGADAVKFQLFKSENIVTDTAKKAKYQIDENNSAESQLNMLKKLEMPFHDQKKLNEYAKSVNIIFLSSPFDLDSIADLYSINMPIFKIPSGEITNYPYLKKISLLKNIKIILSTGMSTLPEIESALNVLKSGGNNNISLLHCNTQYPTPYEDVNLRAIEVLRNEFNLEVGYSDHTPGIVIPISAVSLGATIIEKHFTLDKNMEGPDHKASLDPDEFSQMVNAIRITEKALGDYKKEPSPSELTNISIVRKSIVANKEIKIGDIFTEENLTTKRPGNGISPMEWNNYIGKPSLKHYKKDDLI